MATSYSPKIITDGLVLCLDAADKKSLLAPPTTNLANNSNGTINWTTADLGATVRTQSTVDANSYHYRFVLDKGSGNNAQLRFAFDHTNLTNGETYIMSYKYKITSGSGSFYITDFCDQSVTRVTTDIGDGWYYETAYGTRSSYTETYDFFDALATENMTVDIKEIQVEHTSASSPLATPFVSYQRQWKDRAGSNDGTPENMSDQSNFSSEGGGSLIFDGAGDVVTVTRNSSLSPTDEITQEAWFNLDATGGRVYIGLQYGTSSQNSYALWNANSTTWNGLIRNSSGMNIIQYTRTVNTSNWYHFVHTYDGSNQKLYINSELIKTQVTTGSITYDSNNTEITIGADYNGSGYNTGITAVVDGKQPIARIYNKALTAAEVLQNYNATKGRFGL